MEKGGSKGRQSGVHVSSLQSRTCRDTRRPHFFHGSTVGLDCVMPVIKSPLLDDHRGDEGEPLLQPCMAYPPAGFACVDMTAAPLVLSIHALPVALP